MMNDGFVARPIIYRLSFIVHHSLKIMFRQFISKIPGADVFMIGSFLTFLIFFVLVGVYLLVVDKKYIQQMGQMPLDDSTID
ncbi:hypothetical protein GCM10027423_33060 [Spirosoma arcticum]